MFLHARFLALRPLKRVLLLGLFILASLFLVYPVLTRDPTAGCALFLRQTHCDFLTGWNRAEAAPRPPTAGAASHPIDELIQDALRRLERLLDGHSTTLAQAAGRYRERRGRHPPPGFDDWFAAASNSNAVVVEEFFDRIHHDINPLWGLEPRELRFQASHQPSVIRVRRGKVDPEPGTDGLSHRVEQWTKLVAEMTPYIPDLDMPVNFMDESRVLVPWDKVAQYAAREQEQRRLVDAGEAIARYSGLDDGADTSTDFREPTWITDDANKYWDHFALACPPESPAHNLSALASFAEPVEYPEAPVPRYTYRGFVQNYTASQDPCWQPHLRGMHGTFIESISMKTTHELIPMFGESKLPQNNEILIPAAVYLDDGRIEYSGGSGHGGPWARKKNALVWRGVASGGRNKKDNWWHMHRARFVQMLNGTTIAALEAGDSSQARTFRLARPDVFGIPSQEQSRLGKWVSKWANVGLVEALCDPPEFIEDGKNKKKLNKFCSLFQPWFSLAETVPMKEQYKYKYLPDIDGNSFSGRYRAFLLSTSLPLKSTIYAEWHDDRIFPWVHFVPMDNSFMDIYAIMDYFLGGHDTRAKTIADQGRQWAESVLRREDMKLYVWRLLLEYARVSDDNRDKLAFVGDWNT